MGQTRGNLQQVVNGFGYRQAAAAVKDCPQVFAFNKLESNKMQTLVIATEKNPGDVFMIELGSRTRFLVETANIFRIGGHFRRKNFERDNSVQLCVSSPDHSRHAPDSDRFNQLEMR